MLLFRVGRTGNRERTRIIARALAFASLTAFGGCSDGQPSRVGPDEPPLPPGPTAGDVDRPGERTPEAPRGKGPPYPVLLLHGIGGFRQLGPIEYFHRVEQTLRAEGIEVTAAQAAPFDPPALRARQLVAVVDEVLARTGAEKVVLVGHSQGGLDARALAHLRPGRVAAVLSVSTPHRGSALADLIMNDTGALGPELAARALDLFGAVLWATPSSQEKDAILGLTRAGAATFAEATPDLPGVRYYSIAGRSNLAADDSPECVADGKPPEFLRAWAGTLDMANPIVAPLGAVLGRVEGTADAPAPNDDLVTVKSARWGRFLGCIPADHLDEVGQPLGASPGSVGGAAFDHLAFYRGVIAFLRTEGF